MRSDASQAGVRGAACLAQEVAGTWRGAPPTGAWRTLRTDSREVTPGDLFVALRGERHDGHAFVAEARARGAWAAVVARDARAGDPDGIALLAVEDPRRALAAIATRHLVDIGAPTVIAITGSCGKTTTKRILARLLEEAGPVHAAPASYNNDIGVPLTLLGASRGDRAVVVELGTNAPGEIRALAEVARPRIGIVTMVGRAHLGGFGSPAAILEEKLSLCAALPADGTAILPDDPRIADARRAGLAGPPALRCIRFGESADAAVRLIEVTPDGAGQRVRLDDGFVFRLALAGRHNARNAAAAVAGARMLGVADAAIARAIADLRPEAMRLEPTPVPGGGTILNDAYNANPESMRAGLHAFVTHAPPGRRAAILGTMAELGAAAADLHAELAADAGGLARDGALDAVWFIGDLAAMQAAVADAAAGAAVARAFPTVEAVAEDLRARGMPAMHVLLKASRTQRLERLVPVLIASAAATGAAAAPRDAGATRSGDVGADATGGRACSTTSCS